MWGSRTVARPCWHLAGAVEIRRTADVDDRYHVTYVADVRIAEEDQ